MSDRTVTRIATVLGVLALAFFCLHIVVLQRSWSVPTGDNVGSASSDVANALAGLSFAVVGVIIVTKRRENVLGWLFLITGVLNGGFGLLERYVIYVLVVQGSDSVLARSIVATTRAAWAPSFGVILGLIVLFPSGRFPSRRWVLAAWVGGGALMTLFVTSIFMPGDLGPPYNFEAPTGIEALRKAGMVIIFACIVPILVITFAAAASVIGRFRRARGDEREQFKWFASAAALLPPVLVLHSLANGLYPAAIDAIEFGAGLVIAALPVAVGIAILKYRLYDIDRIINRTLVYGLLSALLALIYFGLVVGLQAAFRPVSGSSNLAIVLTTLIVAALFLPARRRLQTAVDRRFNRRAYDAARTIEAFNARLRQEIDLDTLRYELLAVVDETMQPSGVSLWLREAKRV